MLSLGLILAGLALMIAGGAALVRGASAIATRFGVSPMIVGLTIVGFGTSSPELFINLIGALEGATGVAFGNVVGSNLSNLGLVLALAAMVKPLTIHGDLVRREVPLLLLATTVLTVLALDSVLEGQPSMIGRADSIVLVLLFGIFLYISAMDVLRVRQKDRLIAEIDASPVIDVPDKGKLDGFLVLAGFVMLFFGGELTINNSIALAERLGISTTIVGLFVVAVGTSMPELVTSIIAAVRGESDLAVGNVVGSNIFNTLMVLPVGGLITPIPVPTGGLGDLALSWILAAVLLPVFFFGKARVGRATGGLLLASYATYVVYRILAGQT